MTGTVSVADLEAAPHPTLRRLRNENPVSWVDSLDAWLITSHDLCTQVMRDPGTYTVDDPRFSTGQVIGPSMLSLDGAEHRQHRDPFGAPFRAARIRELSEYSKEKARGLVAAPLSNDSGELRAEVAAPLAVAMMARVLDLANYEVDEVLGWYDDIVEAVHAVTAGSDVPAAGLNAFEDLKAAVRASTATSALLGPIEDDGSLTLDEIAANVAVLLFGGIVTAESSSAIAFRYLLDGPGLWDALDRDRNLVRPFVEETLRIEPSAAAVDRYATRDASLGGVEIAAGDLVRVSISAANRDPKVFENPDSLDINRDNHGRSLTFARGPHACLGIHLARMEMIAAVEALLDHPRGCVAGDLDAVTGLVFRAPETVNVQRPPEGADPTPTKATPIDDVWA